MKTFETNAFLMTIHDDLLIEFKVKANINLESKDVWQSRDLSVDYLPGKKFYVLLEGDDDASVSGEARRAGASEEYTKHVAALALYSNKMYEINSIALADEFNRSHSYWRVKLVKYQDRGDVLKGVYEDDTDDLVTGIEEIFGERIQDEYKKNLKPEIFQTVVDVYEDGIRTFVDRKLRIADYALKNRWTVVSKNHYNFLNMVTGASAVMYEAQSELKTGNGAAYTSWFAPRFASNSVGNYRLIGDSNSTFEITISNTELLVTTPQGTQTFIHGITFDPAKWYGYVVNINNEFLQLSASIYSLDITNNTMLPQNATSNLTNEFTQTVTLTDELIWSTQAKYQLTANEMLMTNIRVFDRPIEFEQHSNILNQYVVRDNQYAIIVDNAIPTIGFQKYANAR